jgi:peptide deformylase
LSAVQIGIPFKIFIAKDYSKSNQFFTFVDCEYEGTSDKILSIEGCLSLKNKNNKTRRFKLERFKSILVKGYFFNLEGSLGLIPFEKEYDGFFSSILQHEIDHHNGILISDIGNEIEIY